MQLKEKINFHSFEHLKFPDEIILNTFLKLSILMTMSILDI